MGKYSDALPKLMRVFELEATAYRANNLGTCHFFLKEFAAARDYFERAIELDPEYPQARAGLGDTFEAFGLHRQAEDAWREAVRLYQARLGINGRPEHRAAMAVYLAKLQQFDISREELEAALRDDPDNSEVLYSAARVYALTGDLQKVYLAVRKAVKKPTISLRLFRDDPCFESLQDDPKFEAARLGR